MTDQQLEVLHNRLKATTLNPIGTGFFFFQYEEAAVIQLLEMHHHGLAALPSFIFLQLNPTIGFDYLAAPQIYADYNTAEEAEADARRVIRRHITEPPYRLGELYLPESAPAG